jgi:hypothetical protein
MRPPFPCLRGAQALGDEPAEDGQVLLPVALRQLLPELLGWRPESLPGAGG